MERRLHGIRMQNAPRDFYSTPAIAVEELLARETFEGRVWEPCCGEGAISRVLEASGHEVVSSDIHSPCHGHGGVDFLRRRPAFEPSAIITNPPYNLATKMVQRAKMFPTVRKVAMLLRLNFLEGRARKPFFEDREFPLARVWVFSYRISCYPGGHVEEKRAGMIPFAWYVWDRSHEGPPALGWI